MDSQRNRNKCNCLAFIWVLGSLSGVALTLCGVFIVRPALNERNFQTAACVVQEVLARGEPFCPALTASTYPCYSIFVTYPTFHRSIGTMRVTSIIHNTRSISSSVCSFVPDCTVFPENNNQSVQSYLNVYGQINSTYVCYYNPERLNEVIIVQRDTLLTIVLSLAIPGGVFVFCFMIILLDKCRKQCKENPNPGNHPCQDFLDFFQWLFRIITGAL